MSQLPWVAAALPDLSRVVEELHAEETCLQERLERVRQRVKAAERLTSSMSEWFDLDAALAHPNATPDTTVNAVMDTHLVTAVITADSGSAAASVQTSLIPAQAPGRGSSAARRMAEPGAMPAGGQPGVSAATSGGNPTGSARTARQVDPRGARSPRQRAVLDVLSQDPAGWWKARAIGDAIGEKNMRSLRGSLNDMVGAGQLVRNADVCYRVNTSDLLRETPMPAGVSLPVPSPRPATDVVADVLDPGRAPKQAQVLQVVRDDPGRWWRPREVADRLSGTNVRRVRALMSQLAKKGLLIKNQDSSYRCNEVANPTGVTRGQEAAV
jgi:hypothetical protein